MKIHIIPLGFEYDRVVKPLLKLKPNKVYLLSIGEKNWCKYPEKHNTTQTHFKKMVAKTLESNGINVQFCDVDMFDFKDIVKHSSKIIKVEKAKGSDVYVCLSGHGKLASIALSVVAFGHDVKAYFVMADDYSKTHEEFYKHGISICHDPEIIWINHFKLERFNNEQGAILKFLLDNRKATTKDILCHLVENLEDWKGYNEILRKRPNRKTLQVAYNRLNRRLKTLEEKGLIKRVKIGRYCRIDLTELGEVYALMV